MDLKIKNGHIIDAELGLDGPGTVCISGKRISADDGSVPSLPEIDASGCYVLPGLIDFHTHVYAAGCSFGVHPDWFPATGVTTTVDGGTSGASNFEAFYRSTIVQSPVRILADLCMSSQGQFQLGFPENYTPEYFDEKKIGQLFEKYPDVLVALKIRLSKETVGALGIRPLEKTLEIADRLQLPIVVHTTNPPVPAAEIVKRLRPGDVYCHCYQGEGETMIGADGHVRPEFYEARERGVLFDACNGTLNFNFRVAEAALADGFFPDIISSDTSLHSFARPYFCKNLPYVMAKYLTLGMELPAVVRAATGTPAKVLGHAGSIGTLKEGAAADVTILKPVSRRTVYGDRKEERAGEITLVPQMTVLGGEVVYCSNDFWI